MFMGMMFVPIIILGLIVWAVVYFTRQPNSPWRSNGESSMEILKTRYARGEISKEQFDEMKRSLIQVGD